MVIEDKLKHIFLTLGIEIDKEESFRNENLLGMRIGLKARDLLVLFFMVEQTFSIHIPEEYIVNQEFNTYNHMLNIIKECQCIKEK